MADFAAMTYIQLAKQWGPWRALDGRYGSDIHPCIIDKPREPKRCLT